MYGFVNYSLMMRGRITVVCTLFILSLMVSIFRIGVYCRFSVCTTSLFEIVAKHFGKINFDREGLCLSIF